MDLGVKDPQELSIFGNSFNSSGQRSKPAIRAEGSYFEESKLKNILCPVLLLDSFEAVSENLQVKQS